MGIISPLGELCQFGFARKGRFRAGQSNSPRRNSHPQPKSFDSASPNLWRYGDYLASGELC